MKPIAALCVLLFQVGFAPLNLASDFPYGVPEITCVTPEGRVESVPVAVERDPARDAVLLDGHTLSCQLREGETTFVIKVSTPALLEHLQLRSEDATAVGSLTISVADEALPAHSPDWTEVDGDIAFHRKRHFSLSLVGVNARYVKLAFRVEKIERLAGVAP